MLTLNKSGDQNKGRKFVWSNQPTKNPINSNKEEASQNLDFSFEQRNVLLDHLAKQASQDDEAEESLSYKGR